MAQWISLPLAVSCFSKIQIGFTFLVPAHPGSRGQRAVKRVCVCVLTGRSKVEVKSYSNVKINHYVMHNSALAALTDNHT